MRNEIRMWVPPALVVASLILAAACTTKPPAGTRAIFPQSGEAAGWSKVRETRTFEAKDLWQYIDGDDQKYLKAGVVKVLTADYRFENRVDAVADVYVMKTAEGARQVYNSESGEGSTPAPLGDGGRLYGASALFHKGRYLVRLTAYESTPELSTALLGLGRTLEKKLAD